MDVTTTSHLNRNTKLKFYNRLKLSLIQIGSLLVIIILLFSLSACSGADDRDIGPEGAGDFPGRKVGPSLLSPEPEDEPLPTDTPKPAPTWTPTPTPRPAATWTPTRTPKPPTSTPSPSPTKMSNLPQISEACSSNKCHIQGFTGGLLLSSHGKTFGLFNSKNWLVEFVSDQEAQAVEHFNCATKPDLDARVRWGFNIAYCRFHDRGFKLGDPIDEGGSIEGNVFKPTSFGIEVDLKDWYGLNNILIKSDGTWEFLN